MDATTHTDFSHYFRHFVNSGRRTAQDIAELDAGIAAAAAVGETGEDNSRVSSVASVVRVFTPERLSLGAQNPAIPVNCVLDVDLRSARRFRNGLVPIGRLPPELLQNVFASVVRGSGKNLVPTLRALASVCSSWFHYVLATKTLWAEISSDQPPADIALALLRTGPLVPLDISLKLDRRTLTAYTKAFLDVIAAKWRSRTWRSFSVDISCHLDQCAAVNVVRVEGPPGALETLKVQLADDHRNTFYAFPLYHGFHADEVHMDDYFSVSWNAERFSGITVLQLTHLGRLHPSPAQIHAVLASSPLLERLCFKTWCPPWDDDFNIYPDEHVVDTDVSCFDAPIRLMKLQSLVVLDIPTYISRAITSRVVVSPSTLTELLIDDASPAQLSEPTFVDLVKTGTSRIAKAPYLRFCSGDKQLQISSFAGPRKAQNDHHHYHPSSSSCSASRFAISFQFRDTSPYDRTQVLQFFLSHFAMPITTLILTCPRMSVANLDPAHLLSLLQHAGPDLTTIHCDLRGDVFTTLDTLAANPGLCPQLRTVDCSTFKGDWNDLLLGMNAMRYNYTGKAERERWRELERLYVPPGAPLFAMEPLFPTVLKTLCRPPL